MFLVQWLKSRHRLLITSNWKLILHWLFRSLTYPKPSIQFGLALGPMNGPVRFSGVGWAVMLIVLPKSNSVEDEEDAASCTCDIILFFIYSSIYLLFIHYFFSSSGSIAYKSAPFIRDLTVVIFRQSRWRNMSVNFPLQLWRHTSIMASQTTATRVFVQQFVPTFQINIKCSFCGQHFLDIQPFCRGIYLKNYKNVFFAIISPNWNSEYCGNHSLWKTGTRLCYIINAMITGDLQP